MKIKADSCRRQSIETLEPRTLLSASYKIVDIGLLPGGSSSAAYGVNAAGVAVGNATAGNGSVVGVKSAGGAIATVGPATAGASTHAYSINSHGDITGETLVGKYQHAYIFYNGSLRDLGTLGGHTSFAYAINDADTVVGGSFIRGDALVHAFIWTPKAGMKDLGTLGGGFSLAYAITAAGKIAGYSTNHQGQNHAFLFDGAMHDLGVSKGATRTIAYAVNAAGQIAGSAKVNNNEHAFVYYAGKYLDLGTLGGTSSSAYGINRSGTIVGISSIAGSSITHAFEYRAGKMIDLNTQIAPSSGWTLMEAGAVNDAGQIVGVGMLHGKMHGFILDPI